jgi:hypothetical protein
MNVALISDYSFYSRYHIFGVIASALKLCALWMKIASVLVIFYYNLEYFYPNESAYFRTRDTHEEPTADGRASSALDTIIFMYNMTSDSSVHYADIMALSGWPQLPMHPTEPDSTTTDESAAYDNADDDLMPAQWLRMQTLSSLSAFLFL